MVHLRSLVFGQIQPQSLELEEAVLAAILLDKDAFALVSNILRPPSFYSEIHRTIYEAVSELAKLNKPIDL